MPQKTLSSNFLSLSGKFFECLFFLMALAMTLFMLLQSLISDFVGHYGETFFIYLFLGVCTVGSVASAIATYYWHRKEKNNRINSERIHTFLRGLIRYWLAYEISLYGFAKIFRTQFAPSYFGADIPVGNLSGFQLTWNYFGYSYTMAVIIACLQIGGSILLLFRRTTLAGVIILLPVMFNIILINQFYHIAAGAYLISVAIAICLLYLFLLRWVEIKTILFRSSANATSIWSRILGFVLKIFVVGCAFATIQSYLPAYTSSTFEGKWKVDTLIRNRKVLKDDDWLNDRHAWKNVYIEQGNIVKCSPNPYVYDERRAMEAKFTYDAKKHRMGLYITSDPEHVDSVYVSINNYNGKSMEWNTILDRDTLKLYLSKVKP